MNSLSVAIDACCLGRRKTGNETYIRGLLSGFAELSAPDLGLHVLTTPHHQEFRNPAFQWHEIPLENFFKRNFSIIPKALKQMAVPLYHASYWAKWWNMPPYLVMIHDLSFVSFPQGFKTQERLVYANLIRQVARRARHILTVSEFAKSELQYHWKVPEEKITVTYNGLDSDCTPAMPLKEISTPYILYVGNLHPRKNLVRLLEAFVLLKKEKKIPHQLKIVGQSAWLFDDIFNTVRKSRIEEDVVFTGYVDRKDLIALYQQAELTVYPSLYEGFGLPVLEAMGCGCPVVTSNTTSIPEVAGDAAVLVDPTSVESIADGIDSVLFNPEKQSLLRARGSARAQSFQWIQTAQKTLAAYHRCLN